jgi:hypothetical protein
LNHYTLAVGPEEDATGVKFVDQLPALGTFEDTPINSKTTDETNKLGTTPEMNMLFIFFIQLWKH